jgi:hypothetical protein
MPELKLTSKVEVIMSSSTERRISAGVMQKINKSLVEASTNVRKLLYEFVDEVIRNSPVYRGLNGEFAGIPGQDLQAEFGLREETARRALKFILATLLATINEKTVRVEPGLNLNFPARLIFKGVLDSKEYEKVLDTTRDPFGYISYSNATGEATLIPWMQWLLDTTGDVLGDMRPRISNYAITYDMSGERANISRSGRAIMIKPSVAKAGKVKTQGRSYKFPSIAKAVKGKNFIEEIVLDKRFRTLITETVREVMNKAFKE